jgi:hypothetical protein
LEDFSSRKHGECASSHDPASGGRDANKPGSKLRRSPSSCLVRRTGSCFATECDGGDTSGVKLDAGGLAGGIEFDNIGVFSTMTPESGGALTPRSVANMTSIAHNVESTTNGLDLHHPPGVATAPADMAPRRALCRRGVVFDEKSPRPWVPIPSFR